MDTKTLIAILVPSVLSIVLAIVNIVLSYLRDKTRKKEATWDAAVQQLIAAMKTDQGISPVTLSVKAQVRHFQFVYKALGCIVAEDDEGLNTLCREFPDVIPSNADPNAPENNSQPRAVQQ